MSGPHEIEQTGRFEPDVTWIGPRDATLQYANRNAFRMVWLLRPHIEWMAPTTATHPEGDRRQPTQRSGTSADAYNRNNDGLTGRYRNRPETWRRTSALSAAIAWLVYSDARLDAARAAACDQNAPFVALYASSALSLANAWLTTGMG